MSAWVKFLSLLYNPRLKGATPEILDPWVARYVNDLRNGRRDLAMDLQTLGENCRTRRTFLGYQSAIRTCLAGEDLSLAPSGRRLLRRTRSPSAGTRGEALTPGNLLRILEHLDTRGRAILYILVSSGARLGEVLSVRLGDLDLEARPARFRIRGAGGDRPRVAFISREAAGAIRVYLIVRDRYVASARSRGGTGDPLLLFPLGPRSFEQIWRLALSKARLERFDPVTNRRTLTPRAARRFFSERMRTVLPEPAVGMMAGNGRPGSPPRYTEEELAGVYLKGEPAVTLHRSRRKESVAEKIAGLESLVGALSDRIGEREEELARIREMLARERRDHEEGSQGR